jgi:hypothetical protein
MHFDGHSDCADGLCGLFRNGRWGAIDYHGNLVLDFAIESDQLRFSEGLALVRGAPGGPPGNVFIDKHGARQFSNLPVFAAQQFSDGLALVTVRTKDRNGFNNDRIGYIDHQGSFKVLNRPLFTTESFSEGRASALTVNPATAASKHVYIDHNLTVVCPLPDEADEATPYHEGIAWVHVNPPGHLIGWTAINMACNQAFPFLVKEASPFAEGVAAIIGEKGELQYVDKT